MSRVDANAPNVPPAPPTALELEALRARWADRPLPELVEHILATYHRDLVERVPRLRAQLDAVAHAHESLTAPTAAVRDALGVLAEDLEDHLMKEERLLFPGILTHNVIMAGRPLDVMKREHTRVLGVARQMRERVYGMVTPLEAREVWDALAVELLTLERLLVEHIFLEDEVLFPRFARAMR
ncbi:MAG: hemerythrin domain-containing protein [Myxococcota bacterium]